MATDSMNTFFSFMSIAVLSTLFLGGENHAAAEWKLTFEDDFSGTELDRRTWKTSDYWGNRTLAGNAELQCYMPDAFRVDDGVLQIVAQRQQISQDACFGAEADLAFTSGMISTAGCNRYDDPAKCEALDQFAQLYGYFEMRARFPAGKGFWPAFWLLPAEGEWPPEIDVVEWLGDNRHTAFFAFHYVDEGERQKEVGRFDGPDFSQDFHTFAVDWQPGQIIWYVDGVERLRVNDQSVPDQAMYMILNMAVGGYWPGSPDASTRFPSAMEVDYVRVYEWTGETSPAAPPQSSNMDR
jgi:beta-glucanase (GH16 family)